MTLPTREKIAEIVREGVCRKCLLPYREHLKAKGPDHNFDDDPMLVADRLLARLRPGWAAVEAERDAMQSRAEAAEKDWQDAEADLRACAEALRQVHEALWQQVGQTKEGLA